MNKSQLASMARAFLLFAGASLVTKGYISSEDMTSLVENVVAWGGLTLTIAPVIWSLVKHRKG